MIDRDAWIITETFPTPPQAVERIYTVEAAGVQVAIRGLDKGMRFAIPGILRKVADAADLDLLRRPTDEDLKDKLNGMRKEAEGA